MATNKGLYLRTETEGFVSKKPAKPDAIDGGFIKSTMEKMAPAKKMYERKAIPMETIIKPAPKGVAYPGAQMNEQFTQPKTASLLQEKIKAKNNYDYVSPNNGKGNA